MFLDLLRRRNPPSSTRRRPARGRRVAAEHLSSTSTPSPATRRPPPPRPRVSELTAFAMTKQLGRNPDVVARARRHGIPDAVASIWSARSRRATAGCASATSGTSFRSPGPRRPPPPRSTRTTGRCSATRRRRRPGPRRWRAAVCRSCCCASSPTATRSIGGTRAASPPGDVVAVADRIDAHPRRARRRRDLVPGDALRRAAGRCGATPNRATLAAAAGAARLRPRRCAAQRARHHVGVGARARSPTAGATQVEPGHGLTGTTPLHAVDDLVEDPAVAYVSEVSHLWNGRAYVFGGGLYVDPVLGDARTRRSSCRRRPRPPRPSRDRSRCRRPRRSTTTRTIPVGAPGGCRARATP